MSCNRILVTGLALILSVISSITFAEDVTSKQPPKKTAVINNPPVNKPPASIPSLDKMHLNNFNAHALDMLRNFNQDSANSNLIFSPISLQFTLAMLGSATNNSAILKQLNFAWHEPSTISINTINEQLTLRLKYIEHPSNSIPSATYFTLANGLFISNKYHINPDYRASISNYNATITNLDFTKRNAVFTINNWVNKQTKRQISKVIDKLTDSNSTAMMIVNAIAFKGQWPKGYFNVKYTKRLPFNGLNAKKPVLTMQQNKLKYYYEDDNLQAIYLPYESSKYALFILLPKSQEKDALDSLLNKLDIDYFNNINNGFFNPPKGIPYSGTLFLPRFKIVYDNQELLEKSKRLLGIDLNAATNKEATFNKALLTDKQTPELIVSQIVHRAIIEVNEKGTKASATTAAKLMLKSAVPTSKDTINFTMKVDHPFIYGIIDSQQQLLFLGTVKSL